MSKFDNMLRHQHAIQKMLNAIYPAENKEETLQEIQPLPEPSHSLRSRLINKITVYTAPIKAAIIGMLMFLVKRKNEIIIGVLVTVIGGVILFIIQAHFFQK